MMYSTEKCLQMVEFVTRKKKTIIMTLLLLRTKNRSFDQNDYLFKPRDNDIFYTRTWGHKEEEISCTVINLFTIYSFNILRCDGIDHSSFVTKGDL